MAGDMARRFPAPILALLLLIVAAASMAQPLARPWAQFAGLALELAGRLSILH